MTPAVLTRTMDLPRPPRPDRGFPASLGPESHRPEVQEEIRDLIRRGTVRVRPVPGRPDLVEVVPTVPGRHDDR